MPVWLDQQNKQLWALVQQLVVLLRMFAVLVVLQILHWDVDVVFVRVLVAMFVVAANALFALKLFLVENGANGNNMKLLQEALGEIAVLLHLTLQFVYVVLMWDLLVLEILPITMEFLFVVGPRANGLLPLHVHRRIQIGKIEIMQ